MNVSEEIKKYNFLQQAAELTGKMNVKTFIVGGFVRDLILKKECKDIDFLIIGDVMTYAQTFANQLGIKDIVV